MIARLFSRREQPRPAPLAVLPMDEYDFWVSGELARRRAAKVSSAATCPRAAAVKGEGGSVPLFPANSGETE